ncbi:MAG: hypothetical protein ACOY6N_07940 [Pseudomonadota bacterium]
MFEKAQTTDKHQWLTQFAAVALAVLLLLYLRPYHGIRHDSTLYLGQALLRWRPEIFGQDLFFVFGSQAEYTVFPYLISRLFDTYGPAQIFLLLTLVGRLLFLVASWALLRRLFSATHAFWGLLALLILSPMYGGNGVFSYGEPFLTGRNIAEPLVLVALALWWADRRRLALFISLVAASIHPLQAIPALLVFWIDLVRQDRRWLHLLWSGVLAALAALLEVQPFAHLLAAYDAQWFAWIETPNSNCFLTQWRAVDWCYLAFDVFAIGLVAHWAEGRLRVFAQTLLIAGAIGLGASLLLVDLMHLVLPAGLQLWRVHWLMHWLAMASLPWLLWVSYRQSGSWQSMRLLLLFAMLAVAIPVGPMPLPPYAILILMPLFLAWPWLSSRLGGVFKRLLAIGLAAMVLVSYGRLVWMVWNLYLQLPDARDVFRPEVVLLSYPPAAGILLAGLVVAWWRWQWMRMPLLGVMLGATVLAGLHWDHRNPWTRQVEAAQFSPGLFGVEIPPRAQVFWEGELLAPWLILNRPSYMNNLQNAGLLFNRGTAEEAHRRLASMHVFNFQKELCQVINGLQGAMGACTPDDEAVAEICAGSNGHLTYVVLPYALRAPPLGQWTVAGSIRGDRPVSYRLYRCEDLLTVLAMAE